MSRQNRRTVLSVENACELLWVLRAQGTSTISEIEDKLDLSAGTIHTHLATLRQYGLVEKQGVEYRLGPEFIIFGENVRAQAAIYQAARNPVDKLAHKSGAFAHLITEYQGELIVIYEAFGDEAIGKEYYTRERDSPMNYVHCSSAGKAILAHLSDERVEGILEKHGLPEMTPNTITDRDALMAELQTVRERGFAITDEERMKGIRAVGAPIISDNDVVLGALSISGPAGEWRGDVFQEEIPKLVIRAANSAEVNLHVGAG